MVRRRKLVNLEQNAEASREQEESTDELSEPKASLQQESDHPSDAVQQSKPVEQVALTITLPVPTEQTTPSASKPAQQLSILNRPKRSISTREPRYEDEFTPLQAKKPFNLHPSQSDYFVHRQGAMLCATHRVSGKRKKASKFGPKWAVLKRGFLEAEAKAKQEAHQTISKESEHSDAEQQLELAEQVNVSARLPDQQATTSVSKPAESQEGTKTNGEVSESVETSQQEPSSVGQQLEPAEQVDEPAIPVERATASVLAEQPSRLNQPKTTPALCYEDEFIPLSSKRKTRLPPKEPKARKLPEFKKPITALKHEWKAKIAKGLSVQCHNYERCNFKCKSFTDMVYHHLKCGTNTVVYTCKCGKFYSNKGSFEQHAYACSEVFKCTHCGKKFHNYSFLVNHTAQCQTAAGKNAAAELEGYKISMIAKLFHTCLVCKDVFVSAEHFSRHKAVIHSSSTSIPWAPPVTMTTAALTPTTVTTISRAVANTNTVTPAVTMNSSVTMAPAITMASSNTAAVASTAISTTSTATTPAVSVTAASAPPPVSGATVTTTAETVGPITATTTAMTTPTSSATMTATTPAAKTTTGDDIILDNDDVCGCVHEPPAEVNMSKMTEEEYDLLKQGWEEKSHTGTVIDCPNFRNCYYSCFTASRMERHFLNCVRGQNYVCPCGYSFRYKFGYVRHKCTCNRITFCEQCDKKYYSKDGYELQVGIRLFYYCDTCGEWYINKLDELGAEDFVSLYDDRIRQKSNETSSQGHGQTTSEEATRTSQQEQNCEDVSAEDHDITEECDTDHEHDVSVGTQGHDVLQDNSKEVSLSQAQEHDTPCRHDTQEEGFALEEHNKLHNSSQEQITSKRSSCQASLVPNVNTSFQRDLSTALHQDFLPLEVTSTTSSLRQGTPALGSNPISLPQVTNSTTTTLSTPHSTADTGNDNSKKSSGAPPEENCATGEPPGESTNQSERGGKCLPARRAKRTKPYNLDTLQSGHRSTVLQVWRKELRETGYVECPMYEYCGCRRRSIAGMQQHYRQCGSIPCPLCNKTFTVTSKFNTHYIMEHNKPPAIEQATSKNVTDTSKISPELGEEFEGYLKKVKKVNGPLPLWLRQKIQDSLPNRGLVGGYVPPPTSNAFPSEVSLSSKGKTTTITRTTMASPATPPKVRASNKDRTLISTSATPTSSTTIVTSSAVLTSAIPSSITSTTADTPISLTSSISATHNSPSSSAPQISATHNSPSSSAPQISATHNSPSSSAPRISATHNSPSSSAPQISATPINSAPRPLTTQISAAPISSVQKPTAMSAPNSSTLTSVVSSTVQVSVTPISTGSSSTRTSINFAPQSAVTTSISIASSTISTTPINSAPQSAAMPISVTSSATPTSVVSLITEGSKNVTTATPTITSISAPPTTSGANAHQSKELPGSSSSQGSQRPAVVRSRRKNAGQRKPWTIDYTIKSSKECSNTQPIKKVVYPPGADPLASENHCRICGKRYQNWSAFLEHYYNCGREWRCQKCRQKYASEYRLKIHEERCSKLELQCKSCGRDFGSRSGLANHVKRCKKAMGLPYYFCETCGKVYLTQEELIEHRSTTHDKAPQQPQSSQSGDPADSSSNQDTGGDTSVNGPSTSREEASAIGEIVSNKNGSFSMDGDLERNRRQLEMRLMLSYWRAELQLNGTIRCPMYKFCGCECNSVNGMRYHYTRCGTVSCPCCERTFTTIGKFHTHFVNNHQGQLQPNRTNYDKRAIPSEGICEIAAKIVKNAVVLAKKKYKKRLQHVPSKYVSTKPSVTKPKHPAKKRATVDHNQDDVSDQDILDDQDYKASGHQQTSSTTKACRKRWVATKNGRSDAASTFSAARICPWVKPKTTMRVKEMRLQANRKRLAEEMAQERRTEEEEARKKLAQVKQAKKMILEREARYQEKLPNSKERYLQEKSKPANAAIKKIAAKPCPPVSVSTSLASPTNTLLITQQQSTGNPVSPTNSQAYFTNVLYSRLKAQLDSVSGPRPEPPPKSPILLATPISPQLLQQSSQRSPLPLILQHPQYTPTTVQLPLQTRFPLSPIVYPPYPSLVNALAQQTRVSQNGGATEYAPQPTPAVHTTPTTESGEVPPTLTVPPPSLENNIMEEVTINVQANINRTLTDQLTVSQHKLGMNSVQSSNTSTAVIKNDNISPTVHDVIHDHPYVPSHMIHNEYYTPEVNFSYKSPPPTDQPELLVISIPRSSYTKPQLDGTTAEQGDEAAGQPQRKSILTSNSSILTSSSILTRSGETEPPSLP